MEQNLASIHPPNRHSIEILLGDLTKQKVDGIINASYFQLMQGGGVTAAIVRKGGQIIHTESQE